MTTPELPFEPASVVLEDLGFEPASVKATILSGQLLVAPKAEGTAVLHLTGKNGETDYLYIETKKFAGQWAFLYNLMSDKDF